MCTEDPRGDDPGPSPNDDYDAGVHDGKQTATGLALRAHKLVRHVEQWQRDNGPDDPENGPGWPLDDDELACEAFEIAVELGGGKT